MLYLTNGWPLKRARVLIGRSIGKHWRAEFYTYTYTQRTPSGAVKNAGRVVTEAVSTGVRRILHSGSKVMRRGKNQDSGTTVQQGDEC